MSANVMPENCVMCDSCNGTGNACGYHVPDDATMPLQCMTCHGHGYVDAATVSEAGDLRALLVDIRDLLWRYREFFRKRSNFAFGCWMNWHCWMTCER